MIVCVISAFCVPSWFIALGEDIGGQGYITAVALQKNGCQTCSTIKWGVMGNGSCTPYSGIAMMTLFCIIIGVYMSFVTLRTSNRMYISIIHGAVNIIGETPIFVSLSTPSVLLGPNPSGIIGMSMLLIVAVVLLIKLPKYEMHS